VTQEDHATHRELVEQLNLSITRLYEDVEARADPVLAEIAHALELLMTLSVKTHEYALDNRARIEELEAGGTRQA
jgi:hypothetical protein